MHAHSLRISVFAGFASLCVSTMARADAAAWMYVGGGGGVLSHRGETDPASALQLDVGMGTSPSNRFVLGGVLKSVSFFGQGTDLSLVQRTATSSYALGDWGLALDLGVYQRWWGPNSTGFSGTVNGGGPWGTNLALTALVGTDDVKSFFVTFGFDWARLTSHRGSGQDWWPQVRFPLETPPKVGVH